MRGFDRLQLGLLGPIGGRQSGMLNEIVGPMASGTALALGAQGLLDAGQDGAPTGWRAVGELLRP